MSVTLADIRAAHERIKPYVHRTPVMTCSALDTVTDAKLFFKCESLQKVGAFKIRGAINSVLQLGSEEAGRGVATHSSGNHAAALALAARQRKLPAYVVMPENAPAIKRAAVAGYGAEIITCAATLEARESTLAGVVENTGAVFIPPYDYQPVIAGQGTCALEFCEAIDELDVIIAPVGGGGLLSGTAVAAKALKPAIKVIGAEPKNADDAYRSLQQGAIVPSLNPATIADGLRTSLGKLTFAIIKDQVDDILTVSEEGIIQAMRTIWERMKIIVEPSAAVALAVLFEYPQRFSGKRVGLILSGGNVDLDRLPWLVR